MKWTVLLLGFCLFYLVSSSSEDKVLKVVEGTTNEIIEEGVVDDGQTDRDGIIDEGFGYYPFDGIVDAGYSFRDGLIDDGSFNQVEHVDEETNGSK